VTHEYVLQAGGHPPAFPYSLHAFTQNFTSQVNNRLKTSVNLSALFNNIQHQLKIS